MVALHSDALDWQQCRTDLHLCASATLKPLTPGREMLFKSVKCATSLMKGSSSGRSLTNCKVCVCGSCAHQMPLAHIAANVDFLHERIEIVTTIGFVGADDSNCQSGTRKGMTVDDRFRQSQGSPEFADLVLVEISERLDDSSLRCECEIGADNQLSELSHEGRVVVMRLDHIRVSRGECGGALDQVRTQGPLRQEVLVLVQLQLIHDVVFDVDEGVPDDLALRLRVHDVVETLLVWGFSLAQMRRGESQPAGRIYDQ